MVRAADRERPDAGQLALAVGLRFPGQQDRALRFRECFGGGLHHRRIHQDIRHVGARQQVVPGRAQSGKLRASAISTEMACARRTPALAADAAGAAAAAGISLALNAWISLMCPVSRIESADATPRCVKGNSADVFTSRYAVSLKTERLRLIGRAAQPFVSQRGAHRAAMPVNTLSTHLARFSVFAAWFTVLLPSAPICCAGKPRTAWGQTGVMAQATHAAFDTQREIDSRPALSRPPRVGGRQA